MEGHIQKRAELGKIFDKFDKIIGVSTIDARDKSGILATGQGRMKTAGKPENGPTSAALTFTAISLDEAEPLLVVYY